MRAGLDALTEEFRAAQGAPSAVLAVGAVSPAGAVSPVGAASGGGPGGSPGGAELVHLSVSLDPGLDATPAAGHPVPGADTAYRIASMTKSFTAAAVLQLRDRGRLRLDDPVAAHVPELAALTGPTADSPVVTVRHLMSMAGGLASDDPWGDRLLDADAATMDGLFTGGATFAATPGTTFVYSNFGYAMLGRVITNAAGRPFQDHISAELLAPLGLTGTSWSAPAPAPAPSGVGSGAGVAPAWWRVDGELVPEPVLADGGFAAMGGLWSTAADLVRWAGWLADAFPPRSDPDDQVLSRASRREMQQVATAWPPRITGDGSGPRVLAGGYGFGLNSAVDSRLGYMVQHSGGLPGFGSDMRWLPDRGVVAVALANLRYAPARYLTLDALDLLAGADVMAARPVAVTPSLSEAAEALVALLNQWEPTRAEALFAFNVELDEPLGRRRQQAADRLAAHGPLTVRSIMALNGAEADVEVLDGRGHPLTLALMLSVEAGPPRIQWYELDETPPPGPPLDDPGGSRAIAGG